MSLHDLQAPKEDGGVLSHPLLAQIGPLAEKNSNYLSSLTVDILGRPLADLRLVARSAVLRAARDYLAAAGEPIGAATDGPIFIAGHQPELFHPGVWIKNFALHGLARRHGAVAVNMVVDNDTAKSTLLRLPAGDHVARLPYDYLQSEVPFEERHVRDEALFRALPMASAQVSKDWPFEPLLGQYWDEAQNAGKRTPLMGERFAAARRVFERRWGCANLEVPISRICQTEAFAWFACHLLLELGRFHQIYNEVVHAYRRRYHLRSRNHPVPDLVVDGDWLETPLWAWRAGGNRRARLFARRSPTGIDLRAGAEPWPRLQLAARPEGFVSQWQELASAGYRVRTRALTTTMFARLFVGEVFVHGLGGGKYDELTDEIVRRFYGCEPPAFLVLTGTLLLPFPRLAATPADRRRLQALERDLWWNPQRHVPADDGDPGELVVEKNRWIQESADSPPAWRQRYRMLRQQTARLRPFVLDEQTSIHAQLQVLDRELRLQQIRARRDYAFCLYPEETLRPFCEQFL